MHTVALFGAGKIGEAISALLGSSGRYKIKICDQDQARATEIARTSQNAEGYRLDLDNQSETLKLLSGCQAVISALPYFCNIKVAKLALKANCHYLDLTEDVATTKAVAEIAEGANVAFMPQAGLAPGFISVIASHLVAMFEQLESVKMRVGALPIYPSNALKYNLTWSTDGLINEYGNMGEAIEAGALVKTFALEGLESFSLDGDEYEAFNTSGGLGTLCQTLAGKVSKLDYKTIRYPGHRDLVAFLMQDLKFNEDRETLKRVFERSIPNTPQDKCIIFVEVRGTSKGRYLQRSYASTIYNTIINEKHLSAIQLTTACGICCPLDLLLNGKLTKNAGFIKNEQIALLPNYLENEFGKYFADKNALASLR